MDLRILTIYVISNLKRFTVTEAKWERNQVFTQNIACYLVLLI